MYKYDLHVNRLAYIAAGSNVQLMKKNQPNRPLNAAICSIPHGKQLDNLQDMLHQHMRPRYQVFVES